MTQFVERYALLLVLKSTVFTARPRNNSCKWRTTLTYACPDVCHNGMWPSLPTVNPTRF
ncbi:uncharacterized protein METZ01_LOCUS103106 [marine metagenome]|uniref:Uncharacterized protein n=1 Tax=marine metagenome TaxID=408172 RepID=A0A381WCR3_9ZZZZ